MDPPSQSSLYSLWPLEGLGSRMTTRPSVTSTVVHNSGATVIDAATAAPGDPLQGFGVLGPHGTRQVSQERILGIQRGGRILRRQHAIDEELVEHSGAAVQPTPVVDGVPRLPTPHPEVSDHQTASASSSRLRRKARFAALLVENAQLKDRNNALIGQLGELTYLRTHNAVLKDSLGKMIQVVNIYRGASADCDRCQQVLRLADYFLSQGPATVQAMTSASATLDPTAGDTLPFMAPPSTPAPGLNTSTTSS